MPEYPEPVQRYFANVLSAQTRPIRKVWHRQEGEFLMGHTWRKLSATQVHFTHPPSFEWNADIRMAPGVHVKVRDSYTTAGASMQARLFGLISLANAAGTPELAQGALQRYLGEAVWFPTALREVAWQPINAAEAHATLQDGATIVSLDFRFNAAGEVTGVYAPARQREVKGSYVPTPWESACMDYKDHQGIRIPEYCEVAWILDGERTPYWRARITEIRFEF